MLRRAGGGAPVWRPPRLQLDTFPLGLFTKHLWGDHCRFWTHWESTEASRSLQKPPEASGRLGVCPAQLPSPSPRGPRGVPENGDPFPEAYLLPSRQLPGTRRLWTGGMESLRGRTVYSLSHIPANNKFPQFPLCLCQRDRSPLWRGVRCLNAFRQGSTECLPLKQILCT